MERPREGIWGSSGRAAAIASGCFIVRNTAQRRHSSVRRIASGTVRRLVQFSRQLVESLTTQRRAGGQFPANMRMTVNLADDVWWSALAWQDERKRAGWAGPMVALRSAGVDREECREWAVVIEALTVGCADRQRGAPRDAPRTNCLTDPLAG